MRRNYPNRIAVMVGQRGRDCIVVLLGVYLFGLAINTHPELDIWFGGSELLRPERILVIPFVSYYLFHNVKLRVTRPVLLGGGFFAMMVLSAATNGIYPTGFFSLAIQYVYVFGLFILITSLQVSINDLRALLRLLVLVLSALAVVGIIQAVTLNAGFLGPDAVPFRFSTYYGYRRPYSLTAEPSYLAMFLTTGVAVLLPVVVSNRPILFSLQNQRYIFGLMLGGVIASGAMSGYITLVGFLVLAFPLMSWKYRQRTMLAAAGTGLIAVFAVVVISGINTSFSRMVSSRLSGLVVLLTEFRGISGSADLRLYRWLTAMEVWRENPLLGVGPGGYEPYVLIHHTTPLLDPQRLVSIDGVWLAVLSMTGVAGFGLYLAIFGSILRQGVAGLSVKRDSNLTDFCLIGVSLVLVQLIGWTFTFSVVDPFRWSMIAVGYLVVLHAASLSLENRDSVPPTPDA